MGILKLKLYQETACYKKPFAFKVAETYPLPPYSTIIGMLHKVLGANSGEYYDMNISIQGDYESIFNNYQSLRNFKGKQVTTMPRNVHQLLDVNLILHVHAEDEVINKLYNNIINGVESFTLGRNEDIVRVDEVKLIDKIELKNCVHINKSAYVPKYMLDEYVHGINYRLNSKYEIVNELRQWEKIDVKYIDGDANEELEEVLVDEDNDSIYFMKKY